MYSACADKVISEREADTNKRCLAMIEKYDRLPWWRKRGQHERVRLEIINEWEIFWSWMEHRINEQRLLEFPNGTYEAEERSE